MLLRFLLVAAILSVVLSIPAPGRAGGTGDTLNQDWLRQDLDVVARLTPLLPPGNLRASEFVAKLDQAGVREARDIGFGNMRYFLAWGGGYITYWITVLGHDDRISAVRIEYSGEDDWQRLKGPVLKAWGGMAQETPHGVRYEYSAPDVMAEMKKSVEEALGAYRPMTVENDSLESYRLLTDPFARYDVGTRCYYAGVEPEGRKAVQDLLVRDQTGLLRGALRSVNPEGRVYAAWALLDMREKGVTLAEEDKKAIGIIRDLKIPISTCDGCLVSEKPGSEILPSLGP